MKHIILLTIMLRVWFTFGVIPAESRNLKTGIVVGSSCLHSEDCVYIVKTDEETVIVPLNYVLKSRFVEVEADCDK